MKLDDHYKQIKILGREERYDHAECGDTKARLYVKRIKQGYLFHCHNCTTSGIDRTVKTTPSETLKLLTAPDDSLTSGIVDNNAIEIPATFTTTLTKTAKDWLRKYGITEQEAYYYKFGVVTRANRLLLPVFKDGKLVYYQARNLGIVDKDNPKYLNCRAKAAEDILFESTARYETDSKTCILTEDILSAIKVGRHIKTYALLGSYIPTNIMKRLQNYDAVGIWLDPDKRKEAIKYATRLSSITGKRAIPIISEADPKEHDDAYIKSKIIMHKL